jgi:hypothetical protein
MEHEKLTIRLKYPGTIIRLPQIKEPTMKKPAWKDMTVEQKCEFLHERSASLIRKIEAQESLIRRLDERLAAAERKIEDAMF